MTYDFKPVGFKNVPFIPKTETRIFLGGRPIDQQVEQTGFKGISKQHYQSLRTTMVNPCYGPGEDWEWLRIPCPAQGCPDTSKECKDWVHKRDECGNPTSYLKWSTEAKIKCDYCQNPAHIKHWTFRCHRHTEYLPHDGTKFTRAISIALRARNIDENFANKLLDWLEDNPY